jgi:hypothetical protein
MTAKRWFALLSVLLTLNLIAIVVARNSEHAEINALAVALLSASWVITTKDFGSGLGNKCSRPKIHVRDC